MVVLGCGADWPWGMLPLQGERCWGLVAPEHHSSAVGGGRGHPRLPPAHLRRDVEVQRGLSRQPAMGRAWRWMGMGSRGSSRAHSGICLLLVLVDKVLENREGAESSWERLCCHPNDSEGL